MASPSPQIDRNALEAQVLEVTRGLLAELGSVHAMDAVRPSANIDSELGLGSLERVELLVRLDRMFGSRLPESAIAEAATLRDVVAALATSLNAPVQPATAMWQPTGRQTAEKSRGDEPAPPPAWAETWQEVLTYRATADSSRDHLILLNDGGEPQRVSFGQLYSDAQRVAAKLISMGIRRGDSVALMLPTCREFFVTYAGVLLASGVPVPIYPPVRADRIAEYAERQSAILRNSESRLLITFQEGSRVAKLLAPAVKSLRGVVTAATLLAPSDGPISANAAPAAHHATDLALLQYTSGSTGNPKGVMLSHANLLANVRAIGQAAEIAPTDVGISWLPLYHDMGLIGAWLMPLYFGLPVVVLSPIAFLTHPESWLWAIHNHRGTITAAPNFAYELAVRKVPDSEIGGLDLSSLRAALNGAESVNAATLERFATRFASHGLHREALTPVYGLAEASLAVTIPPIGRAPLIDRIEREAFARDGRAVPITPAAEQDSRDVLAIVSVGSAVPDHQVRIVNAGGRDAGERTEGAIWFRGPSTTGGYFRNPEASNALFPEGQSAGWLNSGDRGYVADGELFVTGRVKDIILKAGRNLYPHEIEEVAGAVAGVRKGCVVAFGTPDATAGTERLIVVAETRERDPAAKDRVAAEVTERIARAIGLPPDAVDLVAPHTLPKTSSGKLRRNETAQLYRAGTLGAAAAPAWVQIAGLGLGSGLHATGAVLYRGLEIVYGVYAASVFVIWLVTTWSIVSFARTRAAAARITSPALRFYFWLVGCRIQVLGREHWNGTGARVIVSNHTSYFDVPLLMGVLGIDYHFVAKHEVHRMPFIGTFLRKLGHFAFDRSDPQARLRQAAEIEQALRQGESVFVFPEGTFTPQAGVRPFQLGAFKAAADVHCPVIAVALTGTRQFLRDGSFLPRPSRITVTICPPVPPAGDSAVRAGQSNATAGSAAGEARWQDIVRLRDVTRSLISRACGEPLL